MLSMEHIKLICLSKKLRFQVDFKPRFLRLTSISFIQGLLKFLIFSSFFEAAIRKTRSVSPLFRTCNDVDDAPTLVGKKERMKKHS